MPTEFRPVQAYQHLEKAQNLERQGRLDEAMVEFKRAVEADPSISAAHNALGQHYMRKGLTTKAADEFQTAVLLGPNYETCFNLGRARTELSLYAEAASAFQQCLTFVANDPSARYELAYTLYAQGRFTEAVALFQALQEEYPEDWELHVAIANCQIGATQYAAAVRSLQQALRRMPPKADATVVRETLESARRHMEFPRKQSSSVKDQVYADFGTVCLGSGGDDGISIPLYQDHRFTYRDVAVTLRRLAALIAEYDWRFDSVVAVDLHSEPLAMALSRRLGIPLLPVAGLTENHQCLVVLGFAGSRELCEVTLEHIPGRALSFSFALTWPPSEGALTDVVGVHCTGSCALPWRTRPARPVQAVADSIRRALARAPLEQNLPDQIAYYMQKHKRLGFLEATADGQTSLG
jgi:tetratricopeptide (TPR) repeat protein